MDIAFATWSWLTDHATVVSAIVSALAAAAIAIYTLKLTDATLVQAKLTQDAVGLARNEFNATHRPDIIIHAIQFIDVPTGAGDGRVVAGASLLCFNKGTSPAKLIQVRGNIIVTNEPGIDVQRPLVRQFENVASGMKLRFEVISERSVSDMMHGGAPAYCIGTIAYFDASDCRRETGFCYRLAFQPSSWQRAGKTEYEYAY